MTDNNPTVADGASEAPPADTRPWYKRPLTWAIVLVLLAAITGVILYFALSDDDTSTFSLVVIERVDDAGDPLDTEMEASIRATVDPLSWRWVTPPDVAAPASASAGSNSSGAVTFRWGPTDGIENRLEWASTLTLTEELPPGSTPDAASFDCALDRVDEPQRLVVLTVEIELGETPEEPSTATYNFQNFEFLPADIVACTVSNGEPPATTAPPTTVPPTTAPPATTVPPTTVPPTTAPPATTIPPTTVPPTTAPPATTVPPTTAPPAASTLMDTIEAHPSLTTLVSLIDVAGLRDALSDPAATITLFAPNDAAFATLAGGPDAPDLGDPTAVRDLLLAHTNVAGILLEADVLALAQVDVENGGPQPVVVGPPPTVGGAGLAEVDAVADNGVFHVVDTVFTIQP